MADNESSAMTMIVALVALVIIVGLAFFALNSGMFQNNDSGVPDLNVDIGGTAGDGQ